MGKKSCRTAAASATATTAAVASAAAATGTPGARGSRHRTSSAADATAGDLGLLLALYQSLLGQLGTTLDSRRTRDDLQMLRGRAWDQVTLAQQQQQPSGAPATPPSAISPCLLAASIAYFADLLVLNHRRLQRFPAGPLADQPPLPPIPVGLQESQRVSGSYHHGRMSAAAAAAAAVSATPWNPLADAERARSLAERIMQQYQPPPSPSSERYCLQQQSEETWSALIRSESVDSLDSYVCRHEPLLLEIHAGSAGRRRRCIALVIVVLFVVTTFAVVLGICITMLTPRQPP